MKKMLKLKRPHPNKKFRIGRHVVTHAPVEFDLNEKELKELDSVGCQKWISVVGEEEKAPKKKTKKSKE